MTKNPYFFSPQQTNKEEIPTTCTTFTEKCSKLPAFFFIKRKSNENFPLQTKGNQAFRFGEGTTMQLRRA